MTKVTIADCGIGNLLSVVRAFTKCGGVVGVSSDADAVRTAERLALPGVGAFGDCIRALVARRLVEPVIEFARSGRPMIGICVGMQMLFDVGEEFGEHCGLGLIPGRVSGIPDTDVKGRPQKIPHIGWTPIDIPDGANDDRWAGSILDGTPRGTALYFVHSYAAHPANAVHRLADADYGGRRISAVVRKDNVFGTQFHPEKSGPDGLNILRRFLTV